MKKLLKHFNGWIGFVVGTVLFFATPPLYRYIDPTAGAFDAGYIHPIIYSIIVLCVASGLGWALTRATAPGPWRDMDKFFDGDCSDLDDRASIGIFLYLFYTTAFCITVMCIV
jgi:hypothetical protein